MNRETIYLRRMLQMNPLEESPQILAGRRAFFHPDDDSPVFAKDRPGPNHRERMIRRIEGLRRRFWSLDPETLDERLNELDVADLPELAIGVERMKAAAQRREAMDRLKQHSDCFPQFFKTFRRLLIAPPREAALLRSDELRRLRDPDRISDYRDWTPYRRIAQTIEREFPELFALEEQWLREILTGQRRARRSANPSRGYMAGTLVGYLLLQAIYIILTALLPGENDLGVYLVLMGIVAAAAIFIRIKYPLENERTSQVLFTLVGILLLSCFFVGLKLIYIPISETLLYDR